MKYSMSDDDDIVKILLLFCDGQLYLRGLGICNWAHDIGISIPDLLYGWLAKSLYH
jgi:hypothetical protein